MNRVYSFTIFFLLLTLIIGALPINAQTSFELNVQPSKRTISPGMSTAYTILISSSGGFSSPVQLQVANEDDLPNSISVSLFSTTVTPPEDGIGYTILTVSTKSTTSRKEYEIVISARGEGITKTEEVILDVTYKSRFSIDIEPYSKTISIGSSEEFDIIVNSLGSFDDEVDLELDRVPYGMSVQFIPETVKPPEGGSIVATLRVSISEDVESNIYALVIKGSSDDDIVEFSFAIVDIPEKTEFELIVTPSEGTVTLDDTISFMVEATSVGGFSSDIDLKLDPIPLGATFSFDPKSIKPTPKKSESSTLKLSFSPDSTDSGEYEIDVKGSSLGIEKYFTIKLNIEPIKTQLSCEVLISKVKKGDSITVSGEISEPVRDATIKLLYTRPDGTQFIRTVKTDSEGSYNDEYLPDYSGLGPSSYLGRWEISAEWDGTNAYTASKSSVVNLEVVEVSFLERWGLTWVYEYYLWITLAIIILIFFVASLIYMRSRPSIEIIPPKEERPPAAIPEKPRVAIPEKEAALPPKPIKKGKAPSLILPRKKCFNCDEVISAKAKFCDKCRAPQPEKIEKKYEAPPLILPRKYCPNCGEIISTQAKFCDKCKAPQKD